MKFIKYANLEADSSNISVFAKNLSLDEKIVEILFNRGYKTQEEIYNFLHPETFKPQSPYDLDGLEEAVRKIKNAISSKKRILIFGDYDVDGISATTVLLKTLKTLGVKANYFLPNRYTDGYGLTISVLNKILPKYNPDLLITVDCGITAVEETKYLLSKGIDVIITDHHELGEELPNACIVNCKKPNQKYSFNGLCGTGVAYKLAQALLEKDDIEELLPIVAIATIADIVPLKDENRFLVYKGLKLLDKLPAGVKALFKNNKLNLKFVNSTDIAFKIAPKLNASGRMGDANDSLNLYLENNPTTIKTLVEKINNHNTKRQELCSKVFDDANEMLKDQNLSELPAIILYNKTWDSGILGIVCSKLLEKYNKPVFLFSEENDVLKGSARSIKDINIHNILVSVSDILDVFGGHTMAAGLTLKKENIQEFKNRVFSYIYENIDNKVFVPVEYYDLEVTIDDLSLKFLDELKLLEPCGCENASPKFLIKADSIKINPLKKFPNHANIEIAKKLSLIFFNYINESSKLNFGKDYYFIFDLQGYEHNMFKGMVKNFDCSFELDSRAKKFLEPYIIEQLTGYPSGDSLKNVKFYDSSELINHILDLTSSAMGTLFVATKIETYNNFIKTFDTKNIYEFNIISGKVDGFNSIILCPYKYEMYKSYKKIIFLDNVLSPNYVNKIQSLTNAQIYLPKANAKVSQMIKCVDTKREDLLKCFGYVKSVQNNRFISVMSMYSHICRVKKIRMPYADFLASIFIFEELGLIHFESKDGFIIPKIENIKTELTKSEIYNKLLLLQKITK